MVERVSDQASGPPSSGSAAAIVVERLSKRFEATVALEDVSLAIATGEVRAIVGENGAGKSTLVKILSGLVRPDFGEVRIGDAQLGFGSPKRSHAAGIQTAFQEMTLVEGLTVTQNMLLPYEPTWLGLQIDRRASRTRVVQQLAALEITGIDPDALVAELDLPTRQKLEIAKAVIRRPSVLLLDEPTSTLPIADVEWLRRQIVRLKSGGVTIVFISHRMAEVRQLCDSVTVMRNGRHVGSYALDDVSDDEVVRLMIGRSIDAIYPQRGKPQGDTGAPALEVDGLCVGEQVTGLSFAVWPGEIVGVAALQGMGQRELFDALFGVAHADRGSLRRHNQPITLISPVGALQAGISLVPEDRKTEGLFLHLSGKANATLPILDRLAKFGWIDRPPRLLPPTRFSPNSTCRRALSTGLPHRLAAAISRRLCSPSRCSARATCYCCSIRHGASTSAPSTRSIFSCAILRPRARRSCCTRPRYRRSSTFATGRWCSIAVVSAPSCLASN